MVIKVSLYQSLISYHKQIKVYLLPLIFLQTKPKEVEEMKHIIHKVINCQHRVW